MEGTAESKGGRGGGGGGEKVDLGRRRDLEVRRVLQSWGYRLTN